MNGAHTCGCPPAAMSLVGLLMEAGTAYCVPEAGINYKRQMKAADYGMEFLRIPRR
jgi:hypothetical protein